MVAIVRKAQASDWVESDVPALGDERTFVQVARRLADNKRLASRASQTPSLLQGLTACSGRGYACHRGHTTTTTDNKIFYYRCIGSDSYQFAASRDVLRLGFLCHPACSRLL